MTISRNTILSTARRVVASDDFDVRDCGEVIATRVAENTAWELDHDEWLDDETHVVWDVALQVADEANEDRE